VRVHVPLPRIPGQEAPGFGDGGKPEFLGWVDAPIVPQSYQTISVALILFNSERSISFEICTGMYRLEMAFLVRPFQGRSATRRFSFGPRPSGRVAAWKGRIGIHLV
jgi:hypothetical protein